MTFTKMKVALATHVLSEKTETALQFLVEHEQEEFSQVCITTAWFCMLLQKWFKIVTSRRRKLALSLYNVDAYNEAISLLRLVIRVFQGMQVPGGWKPSQTHIIMATSSILELTKYLLTERNYDFVLLGRFLQDIVENLFSLVRLSRPNPTALEVKYRLRQIVISQCSRYVPNSSYHQDDRVDVLDNLLQRPKETSQQNLSAPRQFGWIDPPEDFLTTVEENVLYRMCGYVVKTLIDTNQIKCEECLDSLRTSDRHPASLWTLLTNFRENAQVQVSEEVFHLCKSVEYNLRRWKPLIQKLNTSFTEALEEPLKQVESSLPTCHAVTYLVLKRFSSMRLKQMLKTSEVTKAAPSDGSQFGSKSMGSRFLADNFKG